jgi:TM2 domain-containing membrane protein YozV
MTQVGYKMCGNCRQTVPADAVFCNNCGSQFAPQYQQAEPPIVGVPQQPANVVVNVNPMGYAQPFVGPKSKVAAALFAFFLGGFGAHGFYLGNTGMGVALLVLTLVSFPLMLIVLGFFSLFAVSIICLVQAILYIASSDYDFHQKYVVQKRWF